jgi:hemoglobin/transferrin/lactoferrin receptor protein
VATAFRSPSLEERYQYIDLGSIVLVGNPSLKPEQSVSLNGGIRSHGWGASIQADVFVNILRDLVSVAPGTFEGRPASINTNIGSARLYGGEISAEATLSLHSGVRASVSYVRGEDTRAHVNLPQIPPLLGSLEFRRVIEGAGAASVIVIWAGSQTTFASGENRVPGYCCLNLNIATEPVDFARLAFVFRAGVENLLNQDYRNFLSTLRGIVRSEAGRNIVGSVEVTL